MTIAWNSDDYLRLDCEDDAKEPERVRCPYCGGSGDMAWFESHEHGPIPFDDEPAALYWSGKSGGGFFLD